MADPLIHAIARTALGDRMPIAVEPVGDGISTAVYRLRRGDEVFYLRVLPEIGESFAPEAQVHALLRQRGVRVPEVVYLEERNEVLGRSVMITTEIRGAPAHDQPPGEARAALLQDAGRELAIVNSIPVEGFGWIKRDAGTAGRLEAELPGYRAFMLEGFKKSLAALSGPVLGAAEVDAIRALLRQGSSWLDGGEATLAHGDFDLTHIYQEDGRYTGIIDFGEIRGTGWCYDLGHFRLHDGEALASLLAGYAEAAALPPDAEQQIAITSLLIALRFLARGLRGEMRHPLSEHTRRQVQASIKRDLARLRA